MARLRSGASVSAWLLAPASILLIAGIALPLCATIWLSLSPNGGGGLLFIPGISFAPVIKYVF